MDMSELEIKEVDLTDIENGKIDLGNNFMTSFSGYTEVNKFLSGYCGYQKMENGKYNIMSNSHVTIVENIDMNLDLHPTIEEQKVECPKLNAMDDATLVGAMKTAMLFSSSLGATAVSLFLVSDFIMTFGIPTKVRCADDYPMIFEFGDITVTVAPMISDAWDTFYKFDFKKWCPQLYGAKATDVTAKQMLELIYSLPKDTTMDVLMKRIQRLRVSEEKVKDTADYF